METEALEGIMRMNKRSVSTDTQIISTTGLLLQDEIAQHNHLMENNKRLSLLDHAALLTLA